MAVGHNEVDLNDGFLGLAHGHDAGRDPERGVVFGSVTVVH